MDIREKLRIKNNVAEDDMKKPNDKVRIAQLEAENEMLTECVLELADIIGGDE